MSKRNLQRALFLLLGTGLIACRREVPKEEVVAASSAVPVPATPNRLPPGKLLEGTENAFGLPLPRDLLITGRYGDVVVAEGQASPDDVAEFVRSRVEARHVEVGLDRIIFPETKLKNGDTILRLEIVGGRFRTRLFVENHTRPPAEPGLSDEERWKKAGFTQHGTLLNADQLE